MGAGHHDLRQLYLPGRSVLHRLAPEAKLLGALLFVLVMVATPREQVWAFAVYGTIVAALAQTASLGMATFARRLTVEAPFVAFALLLPLVAPDGWWAAWNILAKATLGVAVSVLLTATTTVPDLITALGRLRVPASLTTILSFMVRYLDVILQEVQRMHVARLSRGDDPRWLGQVRGIAATAGAAFVRCYERGERVHLAMLARGYDGALPGATSDAARPLTWAAALTLPAVALLVATGAWLLQP